MKILVSSLLMALVALPAVAAEPMSATEFEKYVQGKTLYFGQNGQAYGAERYMPNRSVTWSFLDGECKEGHWYEADGMICFVYEDTYAPQCWSFFNEGDKLRAIFENDASATVLYEAQQNDEPMLCHGPEVGV